MDWKTHWLQTFQVWESRLAESGLGQLAPPLKDLLQPLKPLLAQVLWVSQPVFGWIGQGEAAASLAELLYESSEQQGSR